MMIRVFYVLKFSDIDECLTVSCLNGGTCINEIGGFRCECPSGYRGDTCGIGETMVSLNICEFI